MSDKYYPPVEDSLTHVCQCDLTVEYDEGLYHFRRRCNHCGHEFWALHCPHELHGYTCSECHQKVSDDVPAQTEEYIHHAMLYDALKVTGNAMNSQNFFAYFVALIRRGYTTYDALIEARNEYQR